MRKTQIALMWQEQMSFGEQSEESASKNASESGE